MTVHFYFGFLITTPLNAAQRQKVADALDTLGDKANAMPHLRIQLRPRLDGQAYIVELSVPNAPTKAQVVHAIALALGLSDATVDSNTTFTVFGDVNDWENSRQACAAYLKANAAAWETA